MCGTHKALWFAIAAVLISGMPIALVLLHGSAGPEDLDSTDKLIRAVVLIVCPVATALLAAAAYLISGRLSPPEEAYRGVMAFVVAVFAGGVAVVAVFAALNTTEYFPPGA